MSRLWLNDGGLVLADNALTRCATCPCGGVVCNECQNNVASDELEVTISGLANNLCLLCANHNGTFVVPFNSGASCAHSAGTCCVWSETWGNLIGSPCNANDLLWVEIYYNLDATWINVTAGTAINTWRSNFAGQLDCTALNHTIAYLNPSLGCSNPGNTSVTVKSR